MNEIAPTLPARRTFDDWLSPILVKELRQGMRSRVFVLFFLLIQVFLFMLVIGSVLDAQEDRSGIDTENVFFWVIVGFALLALMPLRGLGAIAGETKIRTMETILLTRMTAWRVVFGKWTALFGQSLLFVSAVLPYLVLRYFIGGQDVVTDFLMMMFMLWLSGVLIAVGIAISGLANPVMRIITLIVAFIVLVNVMQPLSARLFTSGVAETLGLLAIYGLFVPALLFELSASVIAPASENHALMRRVLALLFFVAACVLEKMIHGNFQAGVIVPMLVLIAICYFDLSEKPKLQPRMVATMARKGWPGKFAALFLLPGWPSALLFSLVFIPVVMVLGGPAPGAMPDWPLLVLAVFGSILPPVFVCHVFWPKMKQVLLMVLLFNALVMAITSFLAAIGGFAEHSLYLKLGKFFAFLPTLPSFYTSTWSDKATFDALLGWYFVGYGLVTTTFAVLLLASSRGYYRELFALFRQTALKK